MTKQFGYYSALLACHTKICLNQSIVALGPDLNVHVTQFGEIAFHKALIWVCVDKYEVEVAVVSGGSLF